MAHQLLDGVEIHARFQEMGSKRMPQYMQASRLGDTSTRFGPLKNQVGGLARQGVGAVLAGKEPGGWAIGAPIGPKVFSEAGRQQRLTVLLPFALFHT